MREGDPGVEDWQVWEDWQQKEPAPPPGLKPGGPWYPFAAVAMPAREDRGAYTVVCYRRPLVRDIAPSPDRDHGGGP